MAAVAAIKATIAPISTGNDIIITGNELKRHTRAMLEPFIGMLVKVSFEHNYLGNILRRELAYNSDMNQEFIPSQEQWYIFNGFDKCYSNTENIIMRFTNIDTSIHVYRYWIVKVNTAGIVHFSDEPNRWNVINLCFRTMVNKGVVATMTAVHRARFRIKLEELKKKMHTNVKLSVLPVDIIEIILNELFIPVRQITLDDTWKHIELPTTKRPRNE